MTRVTAARGRWFVVRIAGASDGPGVRRPRKPTPGVSSRIFTQCDLFSPPVLTGFSSPVVTGEGDHEVVEGARLASVFFEAPL
jgi:hypothetical protein